MKEIRKKPIILGIGFFIFITSGVFIILNVFQVNVQQTIMDEQKRIMDENRQWAEKITFWEVTGGLGEDIIEGEKMYYDALAKYSAALQAQTIAIFFIIMLSIITVTVAGSLIIKLY